MTARPTGRHVRFISAARRNCAWRSPFLCADHENGAMRVAVVGAEVMGCAAARELARGGHEVTLFEQFRMGHDRGSSHGRSRIFRLAYPELEYVRLAEEALRGWRELEEQTGTKVLELNGLLEV